MTPNFVISRRARWWFQLSAIGTCLLSADEVASVHETVGKWFARVMHKWMQTPIDDKGFSWTLLFGPVALIAFSATAYYLLQTLAKIPKEKRLLAQFVLLIAILSLPGVFGFEALEAYFSHVQHTSMTIFPCFEETAEVIGMYSVLFCAVVIIRQHEL